jgi:hypothetical protein
VAHTTATLTPGTHTRTRPYLRVDTRIVSRTPSTDQTPTKSKMRGDSTTMAHVHFAGSDGGPGGRLSGADSVGAACTTPQAGRVSHASAGQAARHAGDGVFSAEGTPPEPRHRATAAGRHVGRELEPHGCVGLRSHTSSNTRTHSSGRYTKGRGTTQLAHHCESLYDGATVADSKTREPLFHNFSGPKMRPLFATNQAAALRSPQLLFRVSVGACGAPR